MDVVIESSPRTPWLDQAVALHERALSYRSFITMFGQGFLARLYRALLEEGVGFLVVAREGDRLAGFVLATQDGGSLFPILLRRLHRFAPGMALTLARHPALLPRLLQTVLYARKTAIEVQAELMVIAVQEDQRSLGLGGRLLEALQIELERRGVFAYKVTVHAAMEASNRFYLRRGHELERSFEMYGVVWNLYVRRFGSSPGCAVDGLRAKNTIPPPTSPGR